MDKMHQSFHIFAGQASHTLVTTLYHVSYIGQFLI